MKEDLSVLMQRAEEILSAVGNWFSQVWNMELFSSSGSPVRLSQIVVALAVLVVGIIIGRRLAGVIGSRLRKSGRLNRRTAYLLQRLTFYLLVVVITLIALPIAGIPVTIFTVMGGAVAIGVGFGAQNLFNNLISGIIIMIEQPIRVGDIVEVQGGQGRVEEISNRCVRVRRSDGIDVLIPNSFFLEQPVVNWTHSDSDIRGELVVGVAYGSPTEQVRDLMLQAAHEHSEIRKEPAPIVLYEEFGDNALNFRLLFWTPVSRPMDLRRIRSDLHYRIDALFRSAGITIAFPQRDLHLNTLRPLEVTLAAPSGDSVG
jgi:small-conductance mechanosensitive channel